MEVVHVAHARAAGENKGHLEALASFMCVTQNCARFLAEPQF